MRLVIIYMKWVMWCKDLPQKISWFLTHRLHHLKFRAITRSLYIMWAHEGQSQLSQKGRAGPSGLEWPAELSPRPTSWALGWSTLTSSPFITHWSMWRGWVYGRIAAGSPWLRVIAGYSRGILVRGQWWWCARDLEPDPWFNAMNIYGWGWLDKWYNVWHTAVPNATRTEEEVLERRERRKSKMLFCLLACF